MLPILFQDSHLVVVNKFSGLLVHRSAIDHHATEFAVQMLRDQIGQHVYPVHRLDRPTSGALVFGLSSAVARTLSEDFAASRITKKYLCVVRGIPPLSGTISHPLKEELDKLSDKRALKNKEAQQAETDFKTLCSFEFQEMVDRYPTSRYSVVEAIPKTGRKHQIRRHLRHLGHPIIGDVNYGSGKHNRFFLKTFGVQRLLLACTEIGFNHPITRAPVLIKAPLAEDLKLVMNGLGYNG